MVMDDDGRRNGNLTVMDSASRWRWTMRRQLYGEGRHHGDSTAMDNEERRERDGDVGGSGSWLAGVGIPELKSVTVHMEGTHDVEI